MKVPIPDFEFLVVLAADNGRTYIVSDEEKALLAQLRMQDTRYTYYNVAVKQTPINVIANDLDELVTALLFLQRSLGICSADIAVQRCTHKGRSPVVLDADGDTALVIDAGPFLLVIL